MSSQNFTEAAKLKSYLMHPSFSAPNFNATPTVILQLLEVDFKAELARHKGMNIEPTYADRRMEVLLKVIDTALYPCEEDEATYGRFRQGSIPYIDDNGTWVM